MSHYPIVTPQGVYEAVNYLASGPSGLGQSFQGFSSYATRSEEHTSELQSH
mgnify:CR=1 FL=1